VFREHDFYDTHYKFKNHIIIIGTSKVSFLSRFLIHFYTNIKEEVLAPKCIIICEHRITDKMKVLINQSLFEKKIFYLSVKTIDK